MDGEAPRRIARDSETANATASRAARRSPNRPSNARYLSMERNSSGNVVKSPWRRKEYLVSRRTRPAGRGRAPSRGARMTRWPSVSCRRSGMRSGLGGAYLCPHQSATGAVQLGQLKLGRTHRATSRLARTRPADTLNAYTCRVPTMVSSAVSGTTIALRRGHSRSAQLTAGGP